MARQGMGIGAARERIARPRSRRDRVESLADAGAQERCEFVDRGGRERRLALLLEFPGVGAGKEALNQRAAERPQVVGADADPARGAVEMGVLGEFLGAVEGG